MAECKVCMMCANACNRNRRCKMLRKDIKATDRACDLFRAKPTEPDFEIPNILTMEVNILYIMTRAVELLVEDCDRMLKNIIGGHHFDEEKRAEFYRLFDDISNLRNDFCKIERHFYSGSKDADGKFNVKVYDQFREDANELVRFALLFGDRCSSSQKKVDGLFSYIKAMSSKGIVNDGDLRRFNTKKE